MSEPTATRPVRILVVDDEAQILRVLRASLATQGYLVRTAADGAEALQTIAAWQPELVISDLAMPVMDGVELCRQIRQTSAVPIIVLSVRSAERQKVEALDAGADDYVTKPFGAHELHARIRAQLRRRAEMSEPAQAILAIGDFVIDQPRHRVAVRGEQIRLTPKQFDLLVCFAEHAGMVLTHRTLLKEVWGTTADQPEYLRVAIGQLRKKIETTEEPRYLVTEPWIGYRFCPAGTET